MSYLLDTSAVVHLLNLHDPLATRVRDVGPVPIAISSITVAELRHAAARSPRPQRTRAEQDAALAPFRVLAFDESAADRYADVRAHLEAKRRFVGDRELMVAAIALANRMTVVTGRVSEFRRVPGLRVEDWTG